MCVGRKVWRVVSSSDFARVYEHIGVGGMKINDTWVMSSIISPIDTWSENGLLSSLDIDIYEGILSPGEVLYIPKGFPHAATTLDQSLMVASNDMTLLSLHELHHFCNLWLKDQNEQPGVYSASCLDIKRQYPQIQQNYHLYASNVERCGEITLAKATGCESTFDLLEEQSDDKSPDMLFLTPENFRDEITRGPLVVMKSLNGAGVCLYLLKNWSKWAQDYNPKIRVGVITCIFQYKCTPGEDPLYRLLLEKVESEGTPAFLYIERNMRDTLFFYHYYGNLALDDLRIWLGVQTKTEIIWSGGMMAPHKRKLLLLRLFHVTMKGIDYFMSTFGPVCFGIGIPIILIGCIGGFVFLFKYSNQQRQEGKHKKE